MGDDQDEAGGRNGEPRLPYGPEPPYELPTGFFKAALDAVEQAAAVIDPDGRVRYWNRAAEELYGWRADEVHGRRLVDFVIPREGQDAAEAMRSRLAQSGSYVGDWRVMDRHGRLFDVHAAVAGVVDLDGRPIGMLGMSYDVSAQRTAEARSRRLAAIVEGSGDAIVETDLDGLVIGANAAVHDVFGYLPHELVGRDITTVIDPDDLAAVDAAVRGLREGRQAGILRTQGRRKDGSVFVNELRVSAVHDERGALVGFSGINRDVTAAVRDHQRLERSEQRFRARFDADMPQATLDPHRRFVQVNDALCRLMRRDRSELLGVDVATLRHPTSPAPAGGSPLDGVEDGYSDAGSGERVMAAPDGSPIPVFIDAALIRDERGAPVEVVAFVQDMSARVTAERALRRSESRYRAIADTAQEGVWVVDPVGRTLYANDKLAEIFGRTVVDLHLYSARALLGGSGDLVQQKIESRHVRGAEVYEIDYTRPDGCARILRFSASPLTEDDGTPVGSLAMISDVTEVRRNEDMLRRRALRDELTGLANRTLLTDRLEQSLARQRRNGGVTAVLLADLDQFKLVNDTWGHEVGDDLLVQVAERLASAVRPGDTVARFGGDEFVVVAEHASEQAARNLADRMLESLAEPFHVGGERLDVEASIGIALAPPSGAEDLLRHADAAMYEAKARGRNRCSLFDEMLAAQTEERFALGRDLRHALERDELELHYQPIVSLGTGRVHGVEALARWTHPTRGPVSPDTFVAVAETTGSAAALDRWVLRRACRDLRFLAERHPESAKVAVNISARTLSSPDFEQAVLDELALGGIEPGALSLEITEGALMDDPIDARALLARLRDCGVGASIDDFGTGYSSLSYLNTLPVDALKVDRGFVQGMVDEPEALAIVTSIVGMSNALGLRTVAEGIETVEQLDMLRRIGATCGQGWLWSKALPLPELIRALEAGSLGALVPTEVATEA